jgi:hypothetical protein
LAAIAHTLDFSLSGLSQMAMLDIVGHRLANLRLLSDGTTRYEKNWSPAIWNGELLFVQSFGRMRLLRWDGTQLLPAGLESYVGPPIAADFRGGSQLVPIERGFLTVVHAGADFADDSRIYLHRFVALDAELRITGVSPQFVFHRPGIEFAAGLAFWDNTVIVSFGVADMECWLARLPLDRVMDILSAPIDMTPVGHGTKP